MLPTLPSSVTSPRLLPLVFSFFHFATTLLLSLVNHHSTYVLLALPFFQSLLTAAVSAAYGRTLEPQQRAKGRGATEGGWKKVEAGEGGDGSESRSTRAWKIAAADTVGTVCRIIGSRENAPWVWATLEIYTPFIVLLFPHSPTSHPFLELRHAHARLGASALISVVVGFTLWRTVAVTFEGVLFSMAGVLCEAYRQIAVERERESDEGEGEKSENDVTAKAVRLLMSTSLRSMIILPVIYLLAIPLGLQDPHRNHDQPLRLGVLFAYPFVASIATSSLNFSIFTNTFDLFSSIFAYNASNALRLAMLYLTTARNSSTIRLPLIVNCIANAVMYTIMLRLPSSTKIDLPAYSSLSASSTPFVSRQSHRLIASVPVLIPLIWILRLLATHHTVDVVVAHYSIPLPDLKSFIADIRAAPLVRSSRTRVIIYEKGDFTTEQLWRGLSGVARPGRDLEVVHLPNYGREGHTYLSHITALYNDTLPLVDGGRLAAAKHHSSRLFGRKGHSIADHTLFLQSHLAWSYIAEGRLAYTLRANSGFVSFGPYLSTSCGADSEGTGFYFGVPRIFEGVMGRPCKEGVEDDRVLSTWAGQFAASRERVMANSYEFWDELRRTLELPNDDPIHQGWNPAAPSTQDNPAFGHSVERSWPLLMRCTDKKIAEQCRDQEWQADKCQCFDL